MKKIILITLVLSLSYGLFGNFYFFPENPANIANRYHSQICLPLLTNQFNFENSALQLDDINMFQEGYILDDKDKKKLTEDDIEIYSNFKIHLLDFGHRNWNFSLQTLEHCQ